MPHDFVLDTNLLVLLLVGMADRSEVGRHSCVSGYSHSDYDALESFIRTSDEIGAKTFVSPNVWTEVSNLLFEKPSKTGRDHVWSKIVPILREFVGRFEERMVPTDTVVRRREFPFLGVSDAVLLELATETGAMIVTNDGTLGREASRLPMGALPFALVKAAWDSGR